MSDLRRGARGARGREAARGRLAVVHGRFQPLHIGHLEYLLAGSERVEMLVVGITNPDPTLIAFEPTAPDRSTPEANPFTYYERYLMVEAALVESGVAPDAFRIVPFPHSTPERLLHYAPRDAVYLLTIYDDWGETKRRRFEQLGLATRVLWRRSEKVTSGSEIRTLMASGAPWEHLVPRAVAVVIRQHGLVERVRADVGGGGG